MTLGQRLLLLMLGCFGAGVIAERLSGTCR
jgi:hypothetical protein